MLPGGGAGNIEMAAPPGVAAGVDGVDMPPPPPILGGVEGLRFVALAAAVKGMRLGGCGSGTLAMGLRPAGVMMLACAAAVACCGQSAG